MTEYIRLVSSDNNISKGIQIDSTGKAGKDVNYFPDSFFSNIIVIGKEALKDYFKDYIKTLSFTNLKTIREKGLYEFMYQTYDVTGSMNPQSISFPELETVEDYGMYNSFYRIILNDLTLSKLKTVSSYGLCKAFKNCYNNTYSRGSLFDLTFPKLESISTYGMNETFAYSGLKTVSFPLLTTVGNYGLQNCFQYDYKLESISFPELKTIGDWGFNGIFYECSKITTLSLPKVESIGTRGLYTTWYNNNKVSSISLPMVQSIGENGLTQICNITSNNTTLTNMSFPSLVTVANSSFENAFKNCTGLTEIHFKMSMQTTIEGLSGYSDKFGATNATIYFDL